MTRVVLVHGAWHGSWCWADLVPLLVEAGHDVERSSPAQQAMSARAGTVHTLDSAHSPFVSHAADVADIINRVAG